jgi:hypothetical protein
MEKIGGERHFEDACKLHKTSLQALCGSFALERDGRREPPLLHRQRCAERPLSQERASRSQKRNGRTELLGERRFLFRSESRVASGLAEPRWGNDVLGAGAAGGDLGRGAHGSRSRGRERIRHFSAVHRWIHRALVGHGAGRERVDEGLRECVPHLDHDVAHVAKHRGPDEGEHRVGKGLRLLEHRRREDHHQPIELGDTLLSLQALLELPRHGGQRVGPVHQSRDGGKR